MGTCSKTTEYSLVPCCWSIVVELEPSQSDCRLGIREPAPAMQGCGGKQGDLERRGASVEVAQKQWSYAFLGQTVLKLNSLKYKVLFDSLRVKSAEKTGTPKNEGESAEVYENKRQEKPSRESLKMLVKTSDLSRFLEMYMKTRGLAKYMAPPKARERDARKRNMGGYVGACGSGRTPSKLRSRRLPQKDVKNEDRSQGGE